jgi:hypothetical protein
MHARRALQKQYPSTEPRDQQFGLGDLPIAGRAKIFESPAMGARQFA